MNLCLNLHFCQLHDKIHISTPQRLETQAHWHSGSSEDPDYLLPENLCKHLIASNKSVSRCFQLLIFNMGAQTPNNQKLKENHQTYYLRVVLTQIHKAVRAVLDEQ